MADLITRLTIRLFGFIEALLQLAQATAPAQRPADESGGGLATAVEALLQSVANGGAPTGSSAS